MEFNLQDVLSQFAKGSNTEAFGNGHINDTYLCNKFILQRINTNVFKNPEAVMENIHNITCYIREKIKVAGGDPDRETMSIIPTKDGKICYRAEDGSCYRMYTYVENTVSYDVAEKPEILMYAGRAFGKFQRMLSGFPAEKLHETIANFHDTPARVQQLKDAISSDAVNRVKSVEKEIEFALEYSKYAANITEAMDSGDVPLRVTHNDTKLNNVLFDAETGEDVCVVDLDTVMPGSVLYDFGDALRFGASSAEEDETDLDKVVFDLDKFEMFAKGFLGEVGECLTEKEKELLPVSALIMTYECGIRFLADYINGDTYFKIHRENHNLDRARNQFKLVRDIESKLPEMKKIVEKYL